MTLYLASRSERRRQLLKQIRYRFYLIDIEIDETYHTSELPYDYVIRMAEEKAKAGKSKLNANDIVLAADTSVVLDNTVLGKAENQDQALSMLTQLSGRSHEVVTAVSLYRDTVKTLSSISTVRFKRLSKDEIDDYIATNESIGKAGGYAIQGIAAKYIESIDGSYSGIMGLPLYETESLINADH